MCLRKIVSSNCTAWSPSYQPHLLLQVYFTSLLLLFMYLWHAAPVQNSNCYKIEPGILAGVVISDIVLTAAIVLVTYYCASRRRQQTDSGRVMIHMSYTVTQVVSQTVYCGKIVVWIYDSGITTDQFSVGLSVKKLCCAVLLQQLSVSATRSFSMKGCGQLFPQ